MINYKLFTTEIPFFKDDINYDSFPKTFHGSVPESYLSNELLKIIQSTGLTIRLVETFFRNPNRNPRSPIHVDAGGRFTDIAKLNYIFRGNGSKMLWYQPLNDNKIISKTPINTSYISYELDQVKLIESVELHGPAIIQAGVPHSIINETEDRLCVSVVLFNSSRPATMNEVLTLFEPYLI